jgi:hypothetical protein
LQLKGFLTNTVQLCVTRWDAVIHNVFFFVT